jgi:AmmeMemoRadiSam system protein A
MSGFEILPSVAREAIRARLQQRAAALPAAEGDLAIARPVFVTLRARGELRGCIGCLEAVQTDLIAETADRACAAAFDDPRFEPVSERELDLCTIEVSVLCEPEPVRDPGLLDPARYGVVVGDAVGRRGVLLPGIAGIEDPSLQLTIARRKAGISADAPVQLWRFEVVKLLESSPPSHSSSGS